MDEQSTTACCPRETIPDSCSCLDGCECMCLDCTCEGWGEEYEDDWPARLGWKRPLHQNALEAYLRGELRPLGRAATIRPESDYEQDLSKAW